jgi:SAM-dependent methyltransferase
MDNALVRLIGWKATVLHGDPLVYGRWVWLRRHLLPGPLQTLDAGCGNGAFTMYAARIGNQAIGLSFDPENNRTAEGRASLLGIGNARFLDMDLREVDRYAEGLGRFDQILCMETIEHIRNDRKLVADLAALLRPGGRLLLTTPYKFYRPMLGDALSEEEDGGHVRWGYTHDEIRQLMDECGLDVLSEEYLCGFVSQKLTNLLRLLSRIHVKFAWAVTFPLRVLCVLDPLLTSRTRYPHLTIGVVGQRR